MKKLGKKKGMSAIVTTLLMVALALVLVGIIWATVTSLVRNQIKSSSCIDTSGQVSINNRYTCYNSSSHELRFSISMGKISVDSILVAVSSQGTGVSFELPNKSAPVAYVLMYPSKNSNITIPGENSGYTYLFNMSGAGLAGAPDQLEISPSVGGTQCPVSDQLNEIDDCSLLG